jgi:hypothetical protein
MLKLRRHSSGHAPWMMESKAGNLSKCTVQALPRKVFEARWLPEVSSAADVLLQDGTPVAFHRLNLRISM